MSITNCIFLLCLADKTLRKSQLYYLLTFCLCHNPLTYGCCAFTLNNGGHVGTVEYAVKQVSWSQFMRSKCHFFDCNWTLALYKISKKENFTKGFAGRGGRYETDTSSTKLPRPVKYCNIFSTYMLIQFHQDPAR